MNTRQTKTLVLSVQSPLQAEPCGCSQETLIQGHATQEVEGMVEVKPCRKQVLIPQGQECKATKTF